MTTVETAPTLILLILILVSGLVSGMINYMMYHFTKKWNKFEFAKYVFLGIFFSAIVLLVFEAITHSLIYSVKQTAPDYLVLGCMCFIAAIVLSFLMNLFLSKFPDIPEH